MSMNVFTAWFKDLFVRKDGQIVIYVINHKKDLSGESIEKFEYRDNKDQIFQLRYQTVQYQNAQTILKSIRSSFG